MSMRWTDSGAGRWSRGLVLMGAVLAAPQARAAISAAELTVASIPIPGAVYLNTGLLLSASGGRSGFTGGVGGEISAHVFFGETTLVGAGLFGQWQSVNFDHQRLCAGLQFSSTLLGVELGVAHETTGPRGMATTSIHAAPFLSIGIVTASFRLDFPVASTPGELPAYGSNIGLVLAFKFPLRLRVGEEPHHERESLEPPPQVPSAPSPQVPPAPPPRKRPAPPPPPELPPDAPILTPRAAPHPTPSREPLDGPSS